MEILSTSAVIPDLSTVQSVAESSFGSWLYHANGAAEFLDLSYRFSPPLRYTLLPSCQENNDLEATARPTTARTRSASPLARQIPLNRSTCLYLNFGSKDG